MLLNIIVNTKSKMGLYFLIFFLIQLSVAQTACKKLVDSPPPTESISEQNVYSIDATAISVLNGIYMSMNLSSPQPFQGSSSIALFSGLSSDELMLHAGITSTTYLGYYRNNLSAVIGSQSGSEQWSPLYNYIFKCNAALEGISRSASLTPQVKQQLLGEVKFLRAFFYFYLVNLFGDLPLVVSTDPEVNSVLRRSSISDVYQLIKSDLLEAESLLSGNYLDGSLISQTTERVRPTKWAAKAMLARVYLYLSNYPAAETLATEVINQSSLYSPMPALNNVFLKNSREAIWQLQPTAINFNTQEARTLIIPASGPSSGGATTNPVYLSDNLLNSFEPGDQRAVYGNWIDTTIYTVTQSPLVRDTVTYPYKYKINASNSNITSSTGTQFMTEYFMVLRLVEQHLIRAEARAKQSNISGAQQDLNIVRNRAGLGNTTANDQTSLLSSILKERQVELFSEWGHRWFDLKRTGKIDAVMSVHTPIKSNGAITWQSYQALYPLPLKELQTAPNLVQNNGY